MELGMILGRTRKSGVGEGGGRGGGTWWEELG